MIERYIQRFSKLRTDKNRNRWPSITYHKAPHKPFLLLSIMDLISQGIITSSFIEPSFELVETFNIYWSRIMPAGASTSMAHPFPRLKTDGFWERIPNPGYDADTDYNVNTMSKIREIYAGARLDEELFQLMSLSDSRQKLRTALLVNYFAPAIQPVIVEQWMVNYEAHEYSKELLKISDLKEAYAHEDDENGQKKKVRDQGFRKAIVTLYEHRCALCGIRMLTPEGHTVVEAAHIKPWSESHDDCPSNGMALCRLCHWSFDEGLMSVGRDYEVLVSKRVNLDQNFPGHMMTLSDRRIFRPDDHNFWPDQENLKWHREKTYCR